MTTPTNTVARIVRAPHQSEQPYFLIARATAQDTRVSYDALGVLTYLLSKPNDWEVQITDLARRCGKHRIYRILKELRECGYIALEREYKNGKITRWIYQIHETSNLLPENLEIENLFVGNQHPTYKREEQNTETTTDGDGRHLAYSLYEQNIGLLTPLIADELKDLTQDYGLEWLREAMVIAVQSEKRSLKYVAGILKNWKRDGKDSGKGGSVHSDPLLGGLNFVS